MGSSTAAEMSPATERATRCGAPAAPRSRSITTGSPRRRTSPAAATCTQESGRPCTTSRRGSPEVLASGRLRRLAGRRLVNYHARCYHLTPFSALAVMYSISKSQGPKALWKGMGSTFIVHGVMLGAEGIISEFTPLPREIPHRWSPKQLAAHFLLKGLTAVVALPFYCSSLIETVQSEIVRDDSSSGLLDCVREGLARLLGVGAPHSRRLLPLSCLLLPTLTHAVLRYAIASSVQRVVLWLHHRNKKRRHSPLDPLEAHFPELAAAWLGSLVADVVAFPLETALHRLSLQGTRTIIDATDAVTVEGNGGSPLVLPVNTQYDGFADCLHAIRRKEGWPGFYRGFGALVAQFVLHGILLATARTLLRLLLLEAKVS
ncbi:mitochondrial outer membrane protein SLC25A46 isoform X2 [Dunckerocampus dactyliophorus]|uniref:mitochondrial outer membrane protein SLC25A46 isoform X2 n=1 Tax=Dunckerocampus dactyliophorus TaxID=161453 RepID=UPI0024052889|nr:mitochondrial outer membrane protein SLC25A46 isoform X2 [Dunckerocampus dactyliophorus]